MSQGNFYSRVFHPAIRAAVAAGALPKAKFITTAIRRGKSDEKVALRFHDLRHSAASFALAGAGNVEAALFKVQSRLGRKNIATTADIYGHLTRAADQEVAKGISAIVRRQNATNIEQLAKRSRSIGTARTAARSDTPGIPLRALMSNHMALPKAYLTSTRNLDGILFSDPDCAGAAALHDQLP